MAGVVGELGREGSRSVEEQAGAGEAGFGFLQFRNVECGDGEGASFDTRASAWEGRRENNGSAKSQCVGSVRLRGIHVEPVISREKRGIEPSAIGEKGVFVESGHGGL